jgi:hypothetical protein
MSEALKELHTIIKEPDYEKRKDMLDRWIRQRVIIGRSTFEIDRMLFDAYRWPNHTDDAQERMLDHARVSTKRRMAEKMPIEETMETTDKSVVLRFMAYLLDNSPGKKVF